MPHDEEARLKALLELEIMDTDPEKEFDDIVQLASQICETPISLITLLDERRQWFKSRVGLGAPETSRSVAFCAHAILNDELMVVENALNDDRFFDNPLVTGNPDIRFYAGMPLTTSGGFKLGTLCVIDAVPRSLSNEQKRALEMLSNQVIKLLETRIARRKVEQQAAAIKHLNDLNAKMLSIVGHDLRSPLANLYQIIDIYEAGYFSAEKTIGQIHEVSQSVGESISLLDNLMVWATQQFKNEENKPLSKDIKELLEQIAKSFEPKTAAKSNVVSIHAPSKKVLMNGNVFSLLIRNLLTNANKYTQGGSIEINATVDEKTLTVSVTDSGVGMTDEQLMGLFSWDERLGAEGTSGEKGSGIGLKLCKEMLSAAVGDLVVESSPGNGSIFTFTLPIEKR